MGAEIIAEPWNLLIIREMIVGADRFNEIHRGLPGISRTMLSKRLRRLEHYGLVEPRSEPGAQAGYRLTEAGADLWDVLEALGSWSVRWRFPRPRHDQLNPALLLWRMRSGLVYDRLPKRRVVIELLFDGDRPERGWLLLDGGDSSACIRNPMFDVDVYATAQSTVWHEIWYGHRSLSESIRHGEVELTGDRSLVSQFADWFRLSYFAPQVRRRTEFGRVPLHDWNVGSED